MIVLLSAFASNAEAESVCASGFERWVKLSELRVLTRKAGSSGAGGDQQQGRGEACIPTEAARKELLVALNRVRASCVEVSSPDQREMTAVAMLEINEKIVTALPLCRTEEPKVEPPPPPPPPPPPAPSKPPHTASRHCLEISSQTSQRYLLTNRRCAGTTVLAIIEGRGEAGEVICQAREIRRSVSVQTTADAPPQVNYQCILNQDRCTKDRLEQMFPECDW